MIISNSWLLVGVQLTPSPHPSFCPLQVITERKNYVVTVALLGKHLWLSDFWCLVSFFNFNHFMYQSIRM